MTLEERKAMLATMEKLMNQLAVIYRTSPEEGPVERLKVFLVKEFANDYPEIDWHWEGDRIKVDGFTQKEL